MCVCVCVCVCVWERAREEWGDTGRERDRMQCVSLNMGWKVFEIEREREEVERASTTPRSFNRGLSILFASKHPQNTRTLFCLSSSKPASLSLFLSYAAPPPPSPSFSLISCFSFYSPLLLNSLPSSLPLCSRYGTFYTSPSLLYVIYRKVRQRDGGTGSDSTDSNPGPPEPPALVCSWANAYLFCTTDHPSLLVLSAAHTSSLTLSKLHESNFIIYSSLSQCFF